MASFTDRIPTFNPYVAQQPVEDMVKVGMMKQQQYDSNLQKIQQSMSNIAGLQIGRDVDKDYLQTKMDDMTKQLNVFAGSDLSSNKLTTHLRSMVNGIADDEIVQNSVRSTMAAQSARQLQSKYNAEGKGSPSNDYMLDRQLQKWYENPEAGAIFNGTYKPYHDYHKDSMEIIKNVAKDYTQNDVAFDFDEKGNIVAVRDAISRTIIEGITPEKIQSALKSGLSPAAWEQVSVDGIYQYSGATDEQFISTTKQRFDDMLGKNERDISDLKAMEKNAASPLQKQELARQIQSLEDYNKSIKSQYNTVQKQMENGNLDGAKATLFTTDWMSNMANTFSSSSVKKTYETNPFKMVQLKEAEMAQTQRLAKAKMEQDDLHFMLNYGLKQQELQIKRDEAAAKTGAAGGGRFGGLELPKAPNKKSNKEVIVQTEAKLEELDTLMKSNKQKVMEKYNITSSQFDNYIVAKKTGRKSLPVDLQKDLDNYEVMNDQYLQQSAAYNVITSNADKMYPLSSEKIVAPEDQQTVFISDPNVEGVVHELSTSEIIDAFNYMKQRYYSDPKFDKNGNVVSYSPRIHANKELLEEDTYIRDTDDAATREQKLKNRVLYDMMKQSMAQRTGMPTLKANYTAYDINGNELNMVNVLSHVNSVKYNVDTKIVDNKKERDKYMADMLKETQLTFGPKGYGISLPKEADVAEFRSQVLNPLITKLQTGMEGVDVKANDLITYANNFKSASVQTDGEGNNVLYITAKGAASQLSIPLSDKDFNDIFKGRYQPSPEMKVYYEDYVIKMLNNVPEVLPNPSDPEKYYQPKASYWTTAKDGKYETNQFNATLKQEDGKFSLVQYYTVSGNVVSEVSPESADYVYLKLNIYDPVTKKSVENITYPTPVHVTQIDNTVNSFTDDIIYQMLVNDPMAAMPAEYFKKLQTAATKN